MRIKELINELQKLQNDFGDDIEVEILFYHTMEDFRFDPIRSIEESENQNGKQIIGITPENSFVDMGPY